MKFDFLTDDAKLYLYLLDSRLAHSARWVAHETGVDPAYAEKALARMADAPEEEGGDWQIIRRIDLGPDCYEAIEDSAREGR
jgi:hypothetical protein